MNPLALLLSVFLLLFKFGCVSRVGVSDRLSNSRELFSPSLEVSFVNKRQFTFGVVGDLHIQNQDTTRLQTILLKAREEGDTFLVFLGDIVDQGRREDVLAFRSLLSREGWDKRILTVIGNHDVFYDGWDHYREINGPSFFSVEIGNSRFIGLDTADGTVGEGQEEWLRTELGKDTQENVFLLSHYLPVVPGERTYLKLSDDVEAKRLMNLAAGFRVTAWLGAHYHGFVTGRVEGVDYVVAGGGGGRRMAPFDGFFFVQVKVDGKKVSFELRPI